MTRRLPVELAGQLLSVLDGGPALVRAEAVRVLEGADPQNPATPALAVVVVGWLEAAEQALAAGASAQELQVLLGAAGQESTPGLVAQSSTSPPTLPRGRACRGEAGRLHEGAGRPSCDSGSNVPTWPGRAAAGHGGRR